MKKRFYADGKYIIDREVGHAIAEADLDRIEELVNLLNWAWDRR